MKSNNKKSTKVVINVHVKIVVIPTNTVSETECESESMKYRTTIINERVQYRPKEYTVKPNVITRRIDWTENITKHRQNPTHCMYTE